MFSKIFSIIALTTFLGLASAGPVMPRTSKMCKPNLQSMAVTAFGYFNDGSERVKEWSATPEEGSHVVLKTASKEAFRVGEFILEFSGQPTNTYVIKQVANTQRDLKASVASDGHFVFTRTNVGTQQFNIDCEVCQDDGSDFIHANTCTISDPNTKLCVTGSLGMRACDGSLAQQFGFIQALSDKQLSTVVFE
ncbi:hypothetical protein BD779DRAFT_1541101 [Infundibulicybe gibba]|nr:hypothetical protein BD779DRAFT_1541101 [Infundibulicybe gibba]